jgi:23S rRNA pseudouridine955/2504/2580 synthase
MTTFSKNQVNFYTATENDDNQRLDNLLVKILKNVPKGFIFRIIRSGEVKLNQKKVTFSTKVAINDIIRIPPIDVRVFASESAANNKIPKLQLDILYEDEYYLIINKPSGIACHGGSGISFGIIEQIRQHYSQLKFIELAHRIDKETSGVLVLAKKRQALVKFQELSTAGQINKIYLALTIGELPDNKRNVKAPLYKHLIANGERRVRVDNQLGVFAHSIFNVVTRYKDFTLVSATIKTGRTHQIRVHLQHIGYPIAMDEKYGDFALNKQLPKMGLKRMFLHASRLEFTHPITNTLLKLEAPLPVELQKFLDLL